MKITKDSKITYDPVSLLVDGKRWFPMMGEMHFSRYPAKYWEEELCKMKAGGIDIVSLYVIWIHHEEIRGEFDFTGDRNLRLFLETVQKCGLYSILRIGPWAHGEARNGGFPDWLLQDAKENGYEVRCDAPQYLQHVRRFYEKTYEQAQGLLIGDGGPVIGIQIENEYGHCGGKNGEEGEQHMRTLLAMAKGIGFEAPIYTATGWGGAVTGGMLPVMGGYCEAPWDPRVTEIEPSGNYIFTRERNDHNIGSDHGLGAGITFDMARFPYLTAELGGGLQVTRHRRPIASGRDTAAMTMVKMGSGANLLGYYMYHGGTNPEGKLTTLQETTETGYPNDLPVCSYDFNAPLREYGQMEETYKRVRLISEFVHDFGDDLCDMELCEQPGNSLKPENFTDLRTSVRYKKDMKKDGGEYTRGYLFVNNYQRRYEMAVHRDVSLKAYGPDGETVLASFEKRDVVNGDYFFYPFNMPIGDNAYLTIDATPLCRIRDFDDNGHDAYVFYTDSEREASLEVKGDLDGNKIVILTETEAVNASKAVISGKEYLFITEGNVVTSSDGAPYLYFEVAEEEEKKPTFKCFPELKHETPDFEKRTQSSVDGEFDDSDSFVFYEGKEEFSCMAKASCPGEEEDDDKIRYSIEISDIPKEPEEIFVQIEYEGDMAEMYREGKLIADSFYTGQLWEIGLKRFIDNGGERDKQFNAEVLITPLYEDTRVYLQDPPKLRDGKACDLVNIHLISQYRVKI